MAADDRSSKTPCGILNEQADRKMLQLRRSHFLWAGYRLQLDHPPVDAQRASVGVDHCHGVVEPVTVAFEETNRKHHTELGR